MLMLVTCVIYNAAGSDNTPSTWAHSSTSSNARGYGLRSIERVSGSKDTGHAVLDDAADELTADTAKAPGPSCHARRPLLLRVSVSGARCG